MGKLTTGQPIRTRTVQYSDREVLGEHPDGGYRVSSSDGITEYRAWWDAEWCDYRCTCPARPDKCPHIPVLARWLMEQRRLRHVQLEGEAQEYPIDRALTDALVESRPGKRLEDIFPD